MTNKMNTQTQEALKMAIDWIDEDALQIAHELCNERKKQYEGYPRIYEYYENAIKEGKITLQACKEALAQPAQEPVAFRNKTTGEFCTGGFEAKHLNQWKPLYTHPAPSWQGLESEKVTQIIHGLEDKLGMPIVGAIAVARAIEQAIKEKNT